MTIVDDAARARRLFRSTVRYGPTATRIAVEAKRRGAKQKLLEFAGLIRLACRNPPRTVVEIGTLHGGTLWAWCQVASADATIISIDLPGGAFGGGYTDETSLRLQAYARQDQTIQLLRADSHDPGTLAHVRSILADRALDLLFIDGDHTYDGVRRDFDVFAPLVRPHGLIAFHDIVPHDDPTCHVDRLWREVAEGGDSVEFVDRRRPGERRWGGIGVLVSTPG